MPNRILRDWTDSEPVNRVSVHAERLFTRLIMKVDDFGRLVANPSLLRPMLFPLLLEQVREADLQRQLHELEEAGLIRRYVVQGKEYLEIQNFRQRTRAAKSKCPPPPDDCPSHDSQLTVNRPSHDSHMLTETETETETSIPPADADGPQPESSKPKSPRKSIEPKPVPINRELTDHFTERWKAKYGRKYPFRKLDGIKCAELLKKCDGCVEDAKAVLDAYLADDDGFLNGHSLTLLMSGSQLPKFIAKSRRSQPQKPTTSKPRKVFL